MYGRPLLGKGFLAALACGLGRSCIRPVGAVGRPLATMGCADRVPGIAARSRGAMTKRSIPTQVLTLVPSLPFAPCPIIVRSPPAGGSNGGVAGRWRPPALGVAYVAFSGLVMVAVVVAAVGNAPALSTADQAAAVLRGCQVS